MFFFSIKQKFFIISPLHVQPNLHREKLNPFYVHHFLFPILPFPFLSWFSLHVIIIYIILILCTPLSPWVYNTLNLGMQVTIALIHFGEVLVQRMFGVWTGIYTWSTSISRSGRCMLLVIFSFWVILSAALLYPNANNLVFFFGFHCISILFLKL